MIKALGFLTEAQTVARFTGMAAARTMTRAICGMIGMDPAADHSSLGDAVVEVVDADALSAKTGSQLIARSEQRPCTRRIGNPEAAGFDPVGGGRVPITQVRGAVARSGRRPAG
jgi:hypothetical protein